MYDSEYVLRAIELRVLSYDCVGSLCKLRPGALEACAYFDIHPYDSYITNPFTELPSEVIKYMTREHLKILGSYNELYRNSFTLSEINDIITKCEKYGIDCSTIDSHILIRQTKRRKSYAFR